ncbi:MAG: hypothetical protein K0Q79_3074 [Flavipsychrobacter sp.]|jgi:hypothetical protein|nr:hypothetical protein [Flavipsychrobacter sp.]
MCLKNVLLSAILLLSSQSYAQSFVPPNMDFELGTTANWAYYRGTVISSHVFSLTPSAPVTGLHTLISGSGTDAYGGFPVVGSGLYSLKLAHDTADNNADAASYNIHVPAGGIYHFDYRYAAVLQDPSHPSGDMPIMVVTAVDSATGTVIDYFGLLPSMPLFSLASTGSNVLYKPWTAARINLAGYGGHTVIVKFMVAGCATGGHFGYAYIDADSIFYDPSSIGVASVAIANGAINMYPNPASDALKIQWTNQQTGSADLQIIDVTGRVVSRSVLDLDTPSGETQLNLDGLNNGIYFVAIRSEQINYTCRVVVQK